MTQQFDARKPPVTRTVRRYDRQGQKISYTQMVTYAALKDACCVFILFICLLSVMAYNASPPHTQFMELVLESTFRWLLFMAGVSGFVVTFVIRADMHTKRFYANSRPVPIKETVEAVINTGNPYIVNNREISGHKITFDPKVIEWNGETFALNRDQVRWFAEQYGNGDMSIRKLSNDEWLGTQTIPGTGNAISKSKYTKFIRLCEKRGYIKKIGNENKITNLWIVEVLGLPHPAPTTAENE